MRIYQALNATHIFIPIAIETSGVFGGEALAFFKDIGYRMRSKTQDPQSFFSFVPTNQCVYPTI